MLRRRSVILLVGALGCLAGSHALMAQTTAAKPAVQAPSGAAIKGPRPDQFKFPPLDFKPPQASVLGAVLTLALNSARVTQGAVLLTAYSAGLAIPFLLAALGIGRSTSLMRTHSRLLRGISLATGVLMIILGIMLLTGTFSLLARYGLFVDFGI